METLLREERLYNLIPDLWRTTCSRAVEDCLPLTLLATILGHAHDAALAMWLVDDPKTEEYSACLQAVRARIAMLEQGHHENHSSVRSIRLVIIVPTI